MTKTVIIENLEIWEAQIITAAEELFSPEEIEEYIEIRNVLKNKLVEKSGYDRRLNLAYGIYLIKQTHEVLKKAVLLSQPSNLDCRRAAFTAQT